MIKVMEELAKEINRVKMQIEVLRVEFDQAQDGNDTHLQVKSSMDIAQLTTQLERLESFQRRMQRMGAI